MVKLSPSYERIREVVRKIPRGRVMTYGDVATAAGLPGAARLVGYAMHSLGRSVPWQRVLGRRNARSAHPTIGDPQARARQRQLLEKEGVEFSASGAIDLLTYGWAPRTRASSQSWVPSKKSARRSAKPRSGRAQRPRSG